MKKKMVANEKIDWLYSIIFFLVRACFCYLYVMYLTFIMNGPLFLGFMVVISSINVPTALRRKKTNQKIDELRKKN